MGVRTLSPGVVQVILGLEHLVSGGCLSFISERGLCGVDFGCWAGVLVKVLGIDCIPNVGRNSAVEY